MIKGSRHWVEKAILWGLFAPVVIQQLTEGKQELPKKLQLEPERLQAFKQQLGELMQTQKTYLDFR